MPGVIATIEACIPALRRYGNALLHDQQEVDEQVHDGLVRAIERLQGRLSNVEPRVALFSALHKHCVARASRGRRAAVAPPPALAALDGLPDAQRHVLLLVTVGELSYAETAQVLGMAEDAVVPLLSRAREALRAAMAEPPPALRRVK